MKKPEKVKIDTKKESIDISNVYEVYEGGFGFQESSITTFLGSSTVNYIKADLITFESLLKEKRWPISKVLQREVDRRRVNEIAKGYINSNEKIKYFPPIVVALLPRIGKLLSDKYEPQKNNDYDKAGFSLLADRSNLDLSGSDRNDFIEDDNKCSNAEGLFIKRPYPQLNINFLAWDKTKYFAIVIDGQHRFESLLEAAKEPSSLINNYKQDLIFIDGSKIFFSKTSSASPTELFRRIFMDINKHPILVSESRQIIMDDTDVSKLIVQSLVDDSQVDETNYINPELIDWNTSAGKHELPYLTSILNLYNIVFEKILSKQNIATIEEKGAEGTVEKWVQRLNEHLLIDTIIEEKKLVTIKKISESFEEFKSLKAINEYELFSYDPSILKVAQESFINLFRKSFVMFFKELKVYSSLIAVLKAENIFDANMEQRTVMLKATANRSPGEEILFKKIKANVEKSNVYTNFSIFFSVIGQKSLIDLYHRDLMAKRQGVITEDIHLTITKDFINQNNKIFELLEKCEFKFFGNNDQKKYKEYQVMNNPKISKLGITAHFWDELLYYDNNIKYNSIGLKAIKTVYEYIKQIIECEKTKIVDIPNIHIPEFKTRIKQNLINNHLKTEPEAEKIAIEFVTLKSNFIKETLINAIEGEDSKTKKNDLKTLTSTSTSKSKKK